MSKESIVILVNGVLAAVVLGLVGLGRIPIEVGIPILVALAIPSAAPELASKLRELAANRKPPKGPSVMGLLLVVAVVGHMACHPNAASSPATAPPCVDAGQTIDECARDYTRDLTACTALSRTIEQSLECEDRVRAYYGQPAREDGGAS